MAAARPQREVGHLAHALPAQAGVEAVGLAARHRVQHQQRLAAVAGQPLGSAHQRFGQALAAGAAVHLQLGQVGAVGLVVGLPDDELHRAHDALGVLGHQQRTLAGFQARGHAQPEGPCLGVRQRVHEADGGAAIDAVQGECGQAIEQGVVERGDPA